MTERGMIFNGEMTRAILDGRKTQTRRIMKVQPSEDFTPMNMALETDYKARWYTPGVVDKDGYLQPASKKVFGVSNENEGYSCPFGAVGDRIWVRETFQGPLFDYDLMDSYCKDPTPFEKPEFCVYKADGVPAPEFYDADDELHCCWRPSIHMPRWASRILLEITDVRVERLNSISEEDAGREGYPAVPSPYGGHMDKWLWFRQLWDGIYPEQSFKHNPWVWVLSFKRVEGGAA
ncbi:TPA: hypothetical protein NQE19_001484 [Klebsiella pneumoniae]|uniref:hypothetical protein n=1 Tax=Klebsiella sp. HMSC16C06 TaxID=1581110 RepID=UPI0008A58FCC|nr:hypothetical protein [Klebsiella sp. HMSC16C06]OFV43418.1 hypothetical protein HMPREF3142_06010 [Klebsiella sp. HMSC16C06]HCI9217790.1 hypothetical protein [Klebsiella pneumoniae]HCI9491115.1 hypothetical protein [Klebsiella pneumoniae]